jgi:hypothetical protein
MDYRFLYITIAEWQRPYENYLYGNARPSTPPSKTASPSQDRGRTETGAPSPTPPVNPDAVAPQTEPRASSGSGSQSQQGAKKTDTKPARQTRAQTAKKAAQTNKPGTTTAVAAAAAAASANTTTAHKSTTADGKVKKEGAVAAVKPKEPTPEDLDISQFLTMNCYGPYYVGDSEHMAMFLRNVLTLMLELSDPVER